MSRYSRPWHEHLDESARRSAKVIAPLVADLINPQSVVDVGCGLGAWLSAFQECGVDDILGIDGEHIDPAWLSIPETCFLACDLSNPPAIERRFDLVVCLEVAEHLPERSSRDFVGFLTGLGPNVLFSAAIPFQGGEHHVNEQWPDYWARQFEERDYVVVDCVRSLVWQDPAVEWWYSQNIFLFVHKDELSVRPRLEELSRRTQRSQLSIVHPHRFLEERLYESAAAGGTDVPEGLIERVRPLTMLSEQALRELSAQVRAVLAFDITGNIVECGVWKGGASFLAAQLVRDAGDRRMVWLFDSFEGMPSPRDIDGPAALAYAGNREAPEYFDNCRAAAEDVRRNAADLGVDAYVEIVEGWFDRTLPRSRSRVGSIALLRLDCDWYESTKTCLSELYDLVAPGGLIAIDDYYTYEGSSRAVHEFLASRSLNHKIEPIAGPAAGGFAHYQGAIFRKGGASWNVLRWTLPVRSDVVKIVPAGSSFVLVDQDAFPNEIAAGREMSRYPYPPADDGEAIGMLDRLMADSSPDFLVIVWPAFWWLDFYTGFREHLVSSFPRVIRNERVMAFDLSVSGGPS